MSIKYIIKGYDMGRESYVLVNDGDSWAEWYDGLIEYGIENPEDEPEIVDLFDSEAEAKFVAQESEHLFDYICVWRMQYVLCNEG